MEDELLEKLIIDKYFNSSFRDLYKSYKRTSGVTQKIIGNLLACRLTGDDAIVDFEDLDKILDCASVDVLWDLSKHAKSEYIQSESYKRLEASIENDSNIAIEQAKMSKRRRKKIGGKK